MYLGRVVEERETEELFVNPLHPYTRLLLDSMPLGPGRPAGVRRRLHSEDASARTPPAGRAAFSATLSERMPRCASAVARASPRRTRGQGRLFSVYLNAVGVSIR